MDYQIALLTNGASVHIAQGGVTLCDTKYLPDSFDTVGTLAQAKNAANTMDARRPCDDCIERARELLDEERDDETTEVEASGIEEAHAEAHHHTHTTQKGPTMSHLNGSDLLARVSRTREPNHLHRIEGTTSGYSLVYTGTLIDEITVGMVSRTRVRLSVVGEDNIRTLAGLVDEGEQWWPNADRQHEWESGQPSSTDLWWFMDVNTGREPHASREISVLYDVIALIGRLLDGTTDPLTEASQDQVELDQVEEHAARLRSTRDTKTRTGLDMGATLADAARKVGLTEQAIARIRDRAPRVTDEPTA